MTRVDEEQVLLLRRACASPAPNSRAARSVWESDGAGGQRRRQRVAVPKPSALEVVGIPAAKRRNPPSPWQAVYDALPDGKAVNMTEEQAIAFAAWARQHECKVRRRKVDGNTCAVWRDRQNG